MEKCITTILNNPPTEEDGEQCTPLVDVVSLPLFTRLLLRVPLSFEGYVDTMPVSFLC